MSSIEQGIRYWLKQRWKSQKQQLLMILYEFTIWLFNIAMENHHF